MNTLKQRVRKLEGRVGTGSTELSAVIQGLLIPMDPDDPTLGDGPNEDGEALISPWWSVWFFEGTKEQQEARLKELRQEPQFQKPWNEDEIPVGFEGGACIDEVFCRLHERELSEKCRKKLSERSQD